MSIFGYITQAALGLRYSLRSAMIEPEDVHITLSFKTPEDFSKFSHAVLSDTEAALMLAPRERPNMDFGCYFMGFPWLAKVQKPWKDGKEFDCPILIEALDVASLNRALEKAIAAVRRTNAQITSIKIVERTTFTEKDPELFMVYVQGKRE